MFKRLRRIIEDPKRIKRAIQRRMPGVITAGPRAVTKKIRYKGLELFKKQYTQDPDGIECFQREVLAREVFSDKPWIIPIKERGKNWIALPFLPDHTRLDNAAPDLDRNTRLQVVRQSMMILLDIHTAGYFHGDYFTENLFWYQGQIVVGDFEKLTTYPKGQRPPFVKAYDITGDAMGISIPGDPNAPVMFYSAVPEEKPLASVLEVPLEQAMEELKDALSSELKEVCLAFKSLDSRHTIRAQRIYSSFSLPYFSVPTDNVQRNSAMRMSKLGISEEVLKGRSLLDLGCNIGGMIFESQQYEPGSSRGVEYDADKVTAAKKIAAFNGLNNVQFLQANIDESTSESLGGAADIVYCFALVMHVEKPDHLYKLLGEVTKEVLFFEGNRDTNQEQVMRKLKENGFGSVEFIGLCDDDCLEDNNCRPLFIAKK